jgi:hypothetical protein
MKWYDYFIGFKFLGGTKVVLGVIGALMIYQGYVQIPAENKAGAFWTLILGVGAALGLFFYFRNDEKRIRANGNYKEPEKK